MRGDAKTEQPQKTARSRRSALNNLLSDNSSSGDLIDVIVQKLHNILEVYMACECCYYGNSYHEDHKSLGTTKVECFYPYSVDEVVPNEPFDLIRGRFKKPRDTCKYFASNKTMQSN